MRAEACLKKTKATGSDLLRFIRFSLVGSLGSVLNFLIYYYASEKLGIGINGSATLAFLLAVTSNFLLNYFWTFYDESTKRTITIKLYGLYIAVNLKGLLINLLVLNLVVFFFGYQNHAWGQMAGIVSGMVSNFLLSKKIVFNS